MKKINLKDYYAHITTDTFIDIPDEIYGCRQSYVMQELHLENSHKAHVLGMFGFSRDVLEMECSVSWVSLRTL